MTQVVKARKDNGCDSQAFGNQQMFLNDITDYEEVIAQGADANIYGNFADIETLESDYVITDNHQDEEIGIFKQGSILGKVQILEEAFGSDNNFSQDELNSDKSFDKLSENEEEKIHEI